MSTSIKNALFFPPMCLVHGLCSGTAVHGSASQSIRVELAAHRSGVLRQRQSSALLLHTDVWFEGRPSLDWLSDHCCPVCWNGHDTIWLTSCMRDTEIVKYWCFSTGGEAGLGAGALQPNCLLFATAELSYLSCRCKQTSVWSSSFTLSGYAVKPLIMHYYYYAYCFCFMWFLIHSLNDAGLSSRTELCRAAGSRSLPKCCRGENQPKTQPARSVRS